MDPAEGVGLTVRTQKNHQRNRPRLGGRHRHRGRRGVAGIPRLTPVNASDIDIDTDTSDIDTDTDDISAGEIYRRHLVRHRPVGPEQHDAENQ